MGQAADRLDEMPSPKDTQRRRPKVAAASRLALGARLRSSRSERRERVNRADATPR